MPEKIINRACELIRRAPIGAKTRHGKAIVGETRHASFCYVEPRRRDEPDDQGELSTEDWFGAFLPGTDIQTGDAVDVPGEGVFEVIGNPGGFWDPEKSAVHHIEANLKRVDDDADEEEVS